MAVDKKRSVRAVTAFAVAAAALAGTVGLGAGDADAAKLPGGFKNKKVPGGAVSIRLYDESFRIQQPVAHIPTSREVAVSGKVRVITSGALKGATVTTGYLIGCQLNFGANAGANIVTNELNGQTQSVDDVLNKKKTGVKAGFSLSPGTATFVPVIQTTTGDDDTVNSFTFGDARGGVVYSQERFGVNGCAGFAQARALVNVKASSDEYKGNITLYGRPFSIG